MNIEISDETVSEIVKQELLQLYRHSNEEWFECENSDALQSAISLVLKQYMIPSEHSRWALDRLVEHGEKHGLYESDDT